MGVARIGFCKLNASESSATREVEAAAECDGVEARSGLSGAAAVPPRWRAEARAVHSGLSPENSRDAGWVAAATLGDTLAATGAVECAAAVAGARAGGAASTARRRTEARAVHSGLSPENSSEEESCLAAAAARMETLEAAAEAFEAVVREIVPPLVDASGAAVPP